MAVDRCLICGGLTRPWLVKDFAGELGLNRVHYWACVACGFTLSKTHAEMSVREWSQLNDDFHAAYHHGDTNPAFDQHWLGRLVSQADVLVDLRRRRILPEGRWVDYACGDGRLADHVRASGGILHRYDRYAPPGPGWLTDAHLAQATFDLVLTTSVFEHFRTRDSYEQVRALVAPGGVLGLHTLVRGHIPQDPRWFYLLPVHTAFFTNRAMAALFAQWGLLASLYHVEARLWLGFTRRLDDADLARLAGRPGPAASCLASEGFLDYWP